MGIPCSLGLSTKAEHLPSMTPQFHSYVETQPKFIHMHQETDKRIFIAALNLNVHSQLIGEFNCLALHLFNRRLYHQ